MPPPKESLPDDQLIRYLLGSLPADETERLDELSIADDEFAARLCGIEDDLVDAYASGTLTGNSLERFETFYLASPDRRAKVAFARRFLSAVDGSNGSEPAAAGGRPQAQGRRVPWLLAAAALLCLAMGALLVQDARLRRDLREAGRQAVAADARAHSASGQLEEQRKALAEAKQRLADARGAQPAAAVALVLLPQTRGVAPVPTVTVPSASGIVALDLKIDAVGLAPYDVTLRDPATNGIVWRSSALTPQPLRRPPVVPVVLPADVLKPQHYALDLFEHRRGRAAEFVGSYAFEVVRP